MILSFKEFSLNEGGKALEGVRPIKQFEVKDTVEDLKNKLESLLGLKWDDEVLSIGSAGKKKDPNDESGDIDVGLVGYDINDVNNIMSKQFYGTVFNKGLRIVSVPWPIMGDPKNGTVQIDLIPVEDRSWGEFIYMNPNGSKYKSAHRNWLFAAILSALRSNVKDIEGEVTQYDGYMLRLGSGLSKIRKSYVGKTGSILKNGSIVQEKHITNSPETFVEMLFGEGVKPSDVATFEQCWNIISDKSYKFYDRLDIIVKNFLSFLDRVKLEIPNEINETDES